MRTWFRWIGAGFLVVAVTFFSVMVVNVIRPDKSQIDIVEFVKANNLKISEEVCEETIRHRWGEIEDVLDYEWWSLGFYDDEEVRWVIRHFFNLNRIFTSDHDIEKPDYVQKCQICGKVQFGWKQKPVLWYTVDELAVKWRTVDELQTKVEIFGTKNDSIRVSY